MEEPAVTYPLSLTRSRKSVVGSSAGSSFGHGDFIPQEQPGQVSGRTTIHTFSAHIDLHTLHRFFDLVSPGSNSKRAKPPRPASDTGRRQDLSESTDTSISASSRSLSISSESINSTNSVPFAPPPPPPPSLWRKFRNQLSNRVLKRHIRFMAALYLSASMTLIRPVANFLGPMPFLAITIVVYMHPARTVGSQLEVTLFSVIGAILATAWIIPCQLSVAAYNRQFFAKHGTLQADGHVSWLIEAAWFFVGIWIMTTLKARYAKLTCTFLIFTIANIFGYSKTNDNLKFNIHAYWNLIGPMMIGVGICLLVSIVFWPETASEGLGRALNESLDTSRALLNLSTRSFLLNHKIIALPKSVIENAQKEARYEVTYATTDPADYKEVRVVISALMRHLSSMSLVVQNERLLMLGHPDRENDDLETDSEDEIDLAGSEESSSDSGDSDGGYQDQGSMSAKSAASDCMGGGGRGSGPQKHKRGSAAELRRIRQLLMRAEISTDAVLQARKALEEGERRKGEVRSQSQGNTVLGSFATPSTPGGGEEGGGGVRSGKGVGIVETRSLPSSSSGKGGLMESSGSPSGWHNAAPIVRTSAHSSPPPRVFQPRRPKSPEGDRSDGQMNDSTSLRHGASTATSRRSHSLFNNTSSCSMEDRRLMRPESGAVVGLHPESGSDIGARASPTSELPSSLALEARRKKDIERTRKRTEREAKKEQKRQAKQVREQEKEVRDVPPKEVAFGDRKLFLSFLDIVREPLQRLSDSCSISMATMECELVMELNVEKDMMERIKRRNAQRDAIVRRAAGATSGGNSFRKTTSPIVSNLQLPTQDASNDGGSKEPRQSLWQRLQLMIGISSHPLTQDELDFMDVVRNATNKERKRKLSKSGTRTDGIHPRKLQQYSAAVEPFGIGIGEEEGEATLPGGMSYVQYLTQELEVFDQAEADGLRGFIANHPTLDVGPREEIFLIFFYIFALREIARELLRLGRHLEGMKRKQETQMELDGRKKPRRRLWWPKVIGNFERWFTWGSYTQTRASEGFLGMVMRSTKNLEHRQPRLFVEERAHVAAKAAKAAEQEAKRVTMENSRREEMDRKDQLRRRRHSESWDAPKLRRSLTMSALLSRTSAHPGDLVKGGGGGGGGGGGVSQFAPQPGRLAPLSSRLARARTFLSSNNKISGRPVNAPQGDIPVHPLSADMSGNSSEAPNFQDGFRIGRKGESHLQERYTVVDIPEFQHIHRRLPNDHVSSNMHLESAHSPMMSTIRPNLTAPPEVNPLDADEALGSTPSSAGSSHLCTNNQTAEPPFGSQHRPSQVPLLKVTCDDESDDDDDSEDSSFEQELVMGYGNQLPRKRTQSAFADFSRRNSGRESRVSDNPREKRHRQAPVSAPRPQPAFMNVCKPRSFRYQVWEFLQEFKSDEVRYGLKMASALTFVGLWAWLGWMNAFLATDRGQWVMMTIVAVLSPTIGATFSVCAWRIGGTLTGILWAMLTYLAYPENPFVILAMMSVITFTVAYCILISTHPTMGVIMMISFNSIVFGLYHGRTEDNIYETCYKVAITMIIGILISVALNTFLWPVLARRELRKEIALLIGRQGVLFAELEQELQDRESHHSSDDYKLDADRLAFQHVEHQLQTKMIKIYQLLDLSASEPRLKEDFPGKLYKQIAQCCQNILDRMVSMRMAAQLLSTEVRDLVTGPMNYYRRDMVGALLLYFSVLSSSLASKTALPPYLPSARMARLRVIYNVRQAIAAHQAETGEDHYTYIYYYAFSSALEEVIEELAAGDSNQATGWGNIGQLW
ncbi:hypothetical protein BGX24_001890 [Mortierella sp. AD032]|nr:hypothetical protein BGX24_001890 [Mortierella sp. AD032]